MKMKQLFIIYLTISVLSIFGKVKTDLNENKKLIQNNLSFTENKGQVVDQNYNARPDVLFGGTNGKLVFHLKNNGISYQLNRVDSWKEEEDYKTREKRKVVNQSTIYRIDINWLNANAQAHIQKGEAFEGVSNFYTMGCPDGGALNVRSYKDVTYQNLYSGIDLKWYEKNGELKYDYICAAGADYKKIQLQIKGAQLQLQKNGSLLLKTPLGNIEERAPVVFQNGKKLKANYILKGNVLCFNIDNYDPTQELIIDPVVRLWGTYYGASGQDDGTSSVIDSGGNVFLAGNTYTNASTALATIGAHQISHGGGNYDAFLVKFNASGVRQWGTYYGGSGDDKAESCAVDAAGNVYIAGFTTSNTGTVIATVGAHQTNLNGSVDAYIAKFDANGVRQWSTYYGGSMSDIGFFCATDATGNVYLTGWTYLSTGTTIATAGAHQTTFVGGDDAFLVKFNSSGVRQWGTYYGGSTDEIGFSIATDATGNVFLAGITYFNSGTVIATAGAHQTTHGGGTRDAFLAKFDANGVRQWGTYYGGSGDDWGFSCATDATGNVYLSGETPSSTGTVIATAGAHQTTHGGGTADAFLAKFDANGVRQWGTYYGGSGTDRGGYSCTTVAGGNVYLAGYTNSNSGTVIATAGAHQVTYGGGGGDDAFLVKFNDSGVRQWGTYYGGSGTDRGVSCCTDSGINVYMAGYTWLSTGTTIATTGAHQATSVGIQNAFLVKFKDCPVIGAGTSANSPLCQNSALNFTTTITSTLTLSYNWQGPNSFTANIQNPSIANTGTINAGNYTVTINDGQGCSETATVNVTVNLKPIVIANSGSICSGNSFTINPSGAITYTIQGGNAVVSPNSTSAYTIVGTGSNGCVSDAATSNVTVHATPTIAVNGGGFCIGNSFTINPSGANTYTIEGGNSVVSPTANTTYTVIGTSTAGCISNTFAASNVTVNPLPILSVNSGSICSSNSFTINPSGANTYTIEGGNAVVSPTTNTSYTVIGTSSAGCVSQTYATSGVTVNALPTITVNSGSICSGGSFTISPSGANTYTIEGGNSIVTPTANANYTVVGTSTAGCISVSSVTSNIIVNANPTITVNSGSICSGNSFTITPSGANNYTIEGGSSVVTPTANANYTVVGTSTAGCISVSSATSNIIVNANPTITVNSGSICSGNSFTITPSGANTYTIEGGNSVVTPTANANYTVVGTSTAGCISVSSATSNIIVNANPTITVNSGSICSGQSFTMIPGGANTYTFSGGNAIVSPTANTSYSVTGTSTAGCISATAAVSDVTVNALPIITVNSGSICSGQSFTMIPSGANTYTFSGGNAVVSPTVNTSYSVTGTSTAGCISATAAVSDVTVNALPIITVNSGSICAGQSFTMIPGGANTYTIEGGNSVVTPTANANYTVVGTSTAGCISVTSATSNIIVNATPTITVNSGSICSGNSFTMIPSGANTYTFSGGNAVVSPTANTSYSVTGTSTAGCISATAAVSDVTVNALPIITVNSGSICSGQSFTIIPSGANTYTFSGGNAVVSPTANTSYSVTGTSTLGCVSASFAISNLTVQPLPTLNVSTNNTLLCVGQSATLTASGASTYTWNPGGTGTNITVSPTVTANYTITGTSAQGCNNSSVLTQSVSTCASIGQVLNSASELNIYPNPFSTKITIVSNAVKQPILVYNALGSLIYKTEIENEKTEIDLSNQQSGIYFIRIGSVTKKIIKE